MGWLLKLLVLPVAGPIQGLTWIAEKVAEQAEHELYDEGALRGKLMELEIQFDMGEVNQEEFEAAEEELLARLKVIRERQQAQREV